jgi:REP element-mobilizing transposase RayT
MARGNRRAAIFADDTDRLFFLKTLGEARGRTGWRVHAWALMGNHYHLLIETPSANLVTGMQRLQNTYTRRFRPPGSDLRKVTIARVIWEQTTVSMSWLAQHLHPHLRNAANASQQIRRARQTPPKTAPKLRQWLLQSINVA